jgi:hypothetical protein
VSRGSDRSALENADDGWKIGKRGVREAQERRVASGVYEWRVRVACTSRSIRSIMVNKAVARARALSLPHGRALAFRSLVPRSRKKPEAKVRQP